MPQVQVIQPIQQQPKRLRVAAYARVSSDSTDQLNSLSVQVDYYTPSDTGKIPKLGFCRDLCRWRHYRHQHQTPWAVQPLAGGLPRRADWPRSGQIGIPLRPQHGGCAGIGARNEKPWRNGCFWKMRALTQKLPMVKWFWAWSALWHRRNRCQSLRT